MDAPPLISLIVPCLGLSGAELIVAALAREFRRRGFRVDIVVMWEHPDAIKAFPERDRSDVRYFVLGATRTRHALFRLAEYFRRERPNAAVASLWPLTVTAVAAQMLAGGPTLLAVYDHNTLSIQYQGRGLGQQLLLKGSMAIAYPFADARVAVSSGVADDLAALSGIVRNRFSVIYNPLLRREGMPPGNETTEAIWGGWHGPRLLTVGRFKAQKNHALLLRAFKKLLQRRDARLIILGDGPLFESTVAVAAEEGVADKVFFPGAVADPTPFYCSADLFVFSSDYEGFGNVLIEALACGLPIVATDCRSGPAEILEGGRYGRLVPVGDAEAITNAIDEELDAEHDCNALKKRASEFSLESVADQFLQILGFRATAANDAAGGSGFVGRGEV